MRITLNIVGGLLVLSGVVWFLQGINLLPGSFMTGQIRWAVYGGIAVASGIALLLGARRLRKEPTGLLEMRARSSEGPWHPVGQALPQIALNPLL